MFGREYEKKLEEELENLDLPNSVKNNSEEAKRLSDKPISVQDKDAFERQMNNRENIVDSCVYNIDSIRQDMEDPLDRFESFVGSDDFKEARDLDRVDFKKFRDAVRLIRYYQQVVGNSYVGLRLLNDTNKKLKEMVSFEGHLKDQDFIMNKITDITDRINDIHEKSMDSAVDQLERAVNQVVSRERKKGAELRKTLNGVEKTMEGVKTSLDILAERFPALKKEKKVKKAISKDKNTKDKDKPDSDEDSSDENNKEENESFLELKSPYEKDFLKDKEEFNKKDCEFAKSGRIICPICGKDLKNWATLRSHTNNLSDSDHNQFQKYLTG